MRPVFLILTLILALTLTASAFEENQTPGSIELPGYSADNPLYLNGSVDFRAGELSRQLNAIYAAVNANIPSQAIIVGPRNQSSLSVPVTEQNVESIARNLIGGFGLTPQNCELSLVSSKFAMGKTWFVNFQKVIDGIPLDDKGISLAISPSGKANLIWGNLSAAPASYGNFSSDQNLALTMAQRGLTGAVAKTEYLGRSILPLHFNNRTEYHPVHKFMIETKEPFAQWETLVDAESGEVLQRVNRIYYDVISGHVSGSIQPETPFDPFEDRDFYNHNILFNGYEPVVTDNNGDYSINTDNSNPLDVYVTLHGPYLQVINTGGNSAQIQDTVDPPTTFNVYWDDSNSTAAERDAWYSANLIYEWINALDTGLYVMDFPMVCNVNVDGTCNAFWSGWDRSINFFRAGGQCPNIAQIADVVWHEYGHGITDLQTRPNGPDDAMHEGWSDYVACTISDQPNVGRGFFGRGTVLRTLRNNRRYPDNWNGESHNDGLIIGGALWDTRQALSPSPMAYVDSLWHFARYARTSNFEDYFWAFVALDDDDGDIYNGTPNAYTIFHNFGDLHGIGPGTNLTIVADTLYDSEDTSSSHQVSCFVSSFFGPRADSIILYYDNGGGYVPIQMTRQDTSWIGSIPPQHNMTRVNYYIYVVDAGGFRGTAPVGAPDTYYSFYVGPDIIPPEIALVDGPPNTVNLFGPYGPFIVNATDINGINPSEVRLHYYLNSESENVVSMTPTGNENEFSVNSIDLGRRLYTGDIVHYYITALDGAHQPNSGRAPIFGAFDLVMATSEVFENFDETGMNRWTASDTGWVLRNDGHNSPHSVWYSQPTYPDNANATFTMNFDYDLSPYPRAWVNLYRKTLIRDGDTCFVEASNNGGVSWMRVGELTGVVAPRFGWVEFDISGLLSPQAHEYKVRLHFVSDASSNWVGVIFDDFGWTVDPVVGVNEAGSLLPNETSLAQNYPNPFNPQTNIQFSLSANSDVRLEIFDILGRHVSTLVDKRLEPGKYSVTWNGNDQDGAAVASGVYFYRLVTEFGTTQQKMTLLR